MAQERPNVLVLMSDQHSPHLLGCYGNGIVRTPNLDRLAAGGMRFTNAYCPAPLCVPSRMSFMTARLPSRNRVWDNAHVLSSASPCWTHYLGAAGYETALIGRMHFVGADQRHGFERRPLGELCACHPGSPIPDGAAWKVIPTVTCGRTRGAVEITGTGTTLNQWFDRQVTDATVQYLREKAGDRDERPFAAAAGFLLPHNPYVAPRELFEYYRDKVDTPTIEGNQPASVLRQRRKCGVLEPEIPEERVRLARAAYFALCDHFDSLVGEVLDCLDETGLAGNTLVVYTSDHGDMAGEHGLWAKSVYYQASAGASLIARLPGVIQAGNASDAVCNLMDIGPTLVDLAGAGPMNDADGRSLWPTLQGNHPDNWSDETYSELADLQQWPRSRNAPDAPYYPSRMIRSGKWKLWLDADEENLPPVLFDLEADPGEVNDLGESEEHRAVRGELLAKLRTGWDPEEVRRTSTEKNASREVLKAWARAVRPDNPDVLLPPESGIEEDVELS